MSSETLYSLRVRRFPDRKALGYAAATDVREVIARLHREQEIVRIVFAAAPSQNEFLSTLCEMGGIAFDRIVAFHMDEYIGLPADAPQGFANFLRERLFDRVPFRAVHTLNGNTADITGECARYASLLSEAPIDIVCMGIGENGHIAFNDPDVADFSDPHFVKPVVLDDICRTQQVHDGCFASLSDVPETALTLTIPALLGARHHFCVVPAATKATAVRRALYEPIGAQCPATALRLCADATLYIDMESGALL